MRHRHNKDIVAQVKAIIKLDTCHVCLTSRDTSFVHDDEIKGRTKKMKSLDELRSVSMKEYCPRQGLVKKKSLGMKV